MEPSASQRSIREGLPAGDEPPLGSSDLDVFHDRPALTLVHERPHLDGFVETVADADLLRALDEHREKLLLDRRVEDQARGGRAPLARRSERTPERALEGEIEIGVRHDDLGVLAAELEGEALEPLPAALADVPSDRRRAGKGYEPDARMLHERDAHAAPRAVHEIHDPGGDARLDRGFHELDRRRRGVARRLQNDGIAADESGEHLPRGDRHREVPRRDETADADRIAHRHAELVTELDRNGIPEEAPPLPRRVECGIDPLLHVAARLLDDLAHLARHEARDLFLAVLEDQSETVQDLSPLRGGREPPFVIGRPGRLHRSIDVGRGAFRKEPDEIVHVGGISVLEEFAALRGDPFAPDVVEIPVGHDSPPLTRARPAPGGAFHHEIQSPHRPRKRPSCQDARGREKGRDKPSTRSMAVGSGSGAGSGPGASAARSPPP